MTDIRQHPRFMEACNKVATDWRNLAHAILKENAYAEHVGQETKLRDLAQMLDTADRLEKGEIESFTIWQRVNTELTGECVPFLPKA